MLATVINVILVLLGSALGLIFKNRISARFSSGLMFALGLCVLGIGISNMIRTNDTLCVIICMVLGTLLGEGLNIEKRMDGLGGVLRRKLIRGEGNNRFVEGFVNASVLFCVGAMAINGSMEAGMNHNYDIIISKAVIDGVTSITFAAAMGVGVAFSALPILAYQGGTGDRAGNRHRDECCGRDDHRGHRDQYAGLAQGKDPRRQYAPGDLPAAGVLTGGPVAVRADRIGRIRLRTGKAEIRARSLARKLPGQNALLR